MKSLYSSLSVISSSDSQFQNWLGLAGLTNTPNLIYFKEDIKARALQISQFCRLNKIELYFAVKSCQHPQFLSLIEPFIDGFDVSNFNEFEAIEKYQKPVSFYNPCPDSQFEDRVRKVQADLICEEPHLNEIQGLKLLRIDPTLFFPNRTQSRFGCDVKYLRDTKFDGVHFHIRELQEYSKIDFIEIITQILSVNPDIQLINLGGGWHKLENGNLHFDVLKSIRTRFPNIRLRIEPGRFFSFNTGLALGHVRRVCLDTKLIVTDLSKLLHLNWCDPLLITPSRQEKTISIQILGPTCYEHDHLGSYEVPLSWWKSLKVSDPLIFSGLSTYVLQRQTEFNGIKPASVRFI